MKVIYYPGIYIYQGDYGSGTAVLGPTSIEVQNTSCNTLMNELNELKAPDSYPVDCSFTELNNSTSTGVVFFMDPNNQQLVESIEVGISAAADIGYSEEDIVFIYGIITGFVVVLILFVTMIRQLKKISPKLF